MDMASDASVYKTKDLYEAALLYADGMRLTGLEGEARQSWFVFEDGVEAQKLADAYWAGETEVIAKHYADAVRSLKDRLFARR